MCENDEYTKYGSKENKQEKIDDIIEYFGQSILEFDLGIDEILTRITKYSKYYGEERYSEYAKKFHKIKKELEKIEKIYRD